MQTEPAPSNETRYTLCVGDGAARLKLAETELTLADEGIAYELDGRSGLRAFAKLTGVRLQAVNGGPRSPWEALAELTFSSGRPLFVHSSSPWGIDDPKARYSLYCLHRRPAPSPRRRRARSCRVSARHPGRAPPLSDRGRAHRRRDLRRCRIDGALYRLEREGRVLRGHRTAHRRRRLRLLDLGLCGPKRSGQLRSAPSAARCLSRVTAA